LGVIEKIKMSKARNKKDQKKRSRARTQRIKDNKNRLQKMQREMIMRMIEQEKNKGMFDNLQTIDPVINDSEINLEGPSI
jgi:hypothetical protein